MFQWTDECLNLEIADINMAEINLGASWDLYLLYKSAHAKANEEKWAGFLLETSDMLPMIHQQSGWKPLSILVELSITEVEIQWVCVLK